MTTRSKPFRCVALAVLLSIGAGLIWAFIFGFSFSTINSMLSSNDGYEQLVFTHNGTPVIESRTNNYVTVAYRDLDGKPMKISYRDITYRSALSALVDPEKRFFRPSWSQRVRKIADDYYGSESWFWVCDDNLRCHGYLMGYDKVSKAKIGYLGRNGFRSDEPPKEEQFLVNGRMTNHSRLVFGGINLGKGGNRIYLLTEEGLVQINLKNRTVNLELKNEDLISAVAVVNQQRAPETTSDKADYYQGILLRTSDRLLVFDIKNAEVIQTYLLPAELRSDDLTFIPLQDGKALVQKDRGSKCKLFWIDTTGKIAKSRDVNLLRRRGGALSSTSEALTISGCVPSPGIFAGIIFSYPWGPAMTESLGYWAALGRALQIWWPALLLLCLIGVGLAIVCYRRQRKYGLEWTWFWTGFVLFFGLPAFLGYLAHRSWPARLPCPSCGDLAPRDREACFSCHQKFPEPAPTGTEVFAY